MNEPKCKICNNHGYVDGTGIPGGSTEAAMFEWLPVYYCICNPKWTPENGLPGKNNGSIVKNGE